MYQYPILLITGVSCSGKSELKKELGTLIDASRIFLCEVDDNGKTDFKSKDEALEWTHNRVEKFFEEASESCGEDPPRIGGITGIIYPELVESFACNFPSLEPLYCLLEIDDETLRERLKEKFKEEPHRVEPFFDLNRDQVDCLRRQVEATPLHLMLDGTKPVRELAQEVKVKVIDSKINPPS